MAHHYGAAILYPRFGAAFNFANWVRSLINVFGSYASNYCKGFWHDEIRARSVSGISLPI